jgi:hypothetical protein
MDANKTALTHRATATTVAFLDGLGCKPVETEVPVRPGWVADVASFWYPTRTELKKLQLNSKTAKLILDPTLGDNDPATMAFALYGAGPLTLLAEVKTSRQDFLADAKWKQSDPPASICLLAYINGIVRDEEIPTGWIGLELSANGTTIRKIHRSRHVFPQHPGRVLDFVAQVAIRRDHRSRYSAMREWEKAYRAKDRETKKTYSCARLLDGLACWLQNKGWKKDEPLVNLLGTLGIKNTPHYLTGSLAYFEALKASSARQDF